MFEVLIKLGLSEKEAKVYLAALELGEDTVQNIAKKAKVNRATAYVILEKLMKLGLMSTHEQGKKTVFVAEDPHELQNILAEQRRDIEQRQMNLEQSMNQLMAIYNAREDKPLVRYFEGADGLEALDRYGHDQFKQNSESLAIVPIDILETEFGTRRKRAVEDRISRGIRSRTIYTHRAGEIPGQTNEKELREAVFIPRDELPIDATIQIYPDWGVKFYNLSGGRYFGVLIQSPDMARNMTHMFDLAWLGAKVKRGQV